MKVVFFIELSASTADLRYYLINLFSGISLSQKQAQSRGPIEKQTNPTGLVANNKQTIPTNNKQTIPTNNKQTIPSNNNKLTQGQAGNGVAIKRKPSETGIRVEESRGKIQKLSEISGGGAGRQHLETPGAGRQYKERREERRDQEPSAGRRGPAVKREAMDQTNISAQDGKRQMPPQKSVLKVKTEGSQGAHQVRSGDLSSTMSSPKSPISVRKDLMSFTPGQQTTKQTPGAQQQHQQQQQQAPRPTMPPTSQQREVVVKKEPVDMLAAVDALMSENLTTPTSSNPSNLPPKQKIATPLQNQPHTAASLQANVPSLDANVPLTPMSAVQIEMLQRQFEVNIFSKRPIYHIEPFF